MEEHKQTQRLFFAVALNEQLKHLIADLIHQLQRQGGENFFRWTPKDNLHVTLRFMGEIDSDKLPDYISAVKKSIETIHPFQINTTGLIAFPFSRHPHILALGIEKSDALKNLFLSIDGALVSCGLPKEKNRFIPHLTLARSKHHPEAIFAALKHPPIVMLIAQEVTHITLFKTDHFGESGGSVYVPILKIPFGSD